MGLDELFNDYKNYKIKVEGKSENSINQYIYRLKDFLDYKNIKTLNELYNVKASDIKEWLSFLADKGNFERSRNTKLTSIKEIFKYLKEEKKINIDDDILNICFAKVPKREKKYLDRETAEDLFASITNISTKLGMEIIFATGVRFCELIQIKVGDIYKGYSEIIGKGNKERTIYFPPYIQELGKQFINGKRKKIIESKNVDTDILMINRNGKIIDRKDFEDSMKIYAKKFNENPLTEGRLDWWEHFSPHKLRHSFATDQLIKGNDIATVRDEMGHSSIATTNNYVHSNKDRVRMAMLGINKEDEIYNKIMEKQELSNKIDLLNKILENPKLFNKIKDLLENEV